MLNFREKGEGDRKKEINLLATFYIYRSVVVTDTVLYISSVS